MLLKINRLKKCTLFNFLIKTEKELILKLRFKLKISLNYLLQVIFNIRKIKQVQLQPFQRYHLFLELDL
jgi:hypothetical protein